MGEFYNTRRNSKDRTVNRHGQPFNRLIDKLGLLVVNGNVTGDKYGEFTYYNCKGASVIDYLLIFPSFNIKLLHFEVGLLPGSDHPPLIFFISTQNPPRTREVKLPQLEISTNICLRWMEALQSELWQVIYSDPFLEVNKKFWQQQMEILLCFSMES